MTAESERKVLSGETAGQSSSPPPYYELIGMQLQELGEGTSSFVMPADSRLFNVGGVVHGGALASIADASIGAALYTLIDPNKEKPVTVEMKINYMAPVRSGEIISEGRIVQKGKSVAVGESSIYDSGGKLLAKAIATYVVRGRGGED